MNPIQFFVAGKVVGQPRVKAYSRGGHAGVYSPTLKDNGQPHPIVLWSDRVSAEAVKHRPSEPIMGPISVSLLCLFKRPKTHYGTGKNAGVLKASALNWHTSTPDRDNCDKAILDILTGLDFWKNDSQVCDGRVTKRYVCGVEVTGMKIMIEALQIGATNA